MATKKTPTAKKAPAKKATAKKVSASKKVPTEKARQSCGLPVKERQDRFIAALRSLKATSPTSAKPAADIIAADGKLTEFDVYCLGYHKNALAVEGKVKTASIEGVRGLSYYYVAKKPAK